MHSELLRILEALAERQERLMATVADVTAALAAQKTVLDAAVAQINASASAPTASQLDSVVAQITANTAEVQAALTPAAPTGTTGPSA